MNTVAVIGGTGFIGGHLVRHVVSRGRCEVRVLVRDGQPARFQGDNLVYVRGSLAEEEALKRLLATGSTLVNLAHPDAPTQADSLAILRALLEVCAAQRVKRIIHCSTAVVAGNVPDDVVTEATACHPADDYGAAKLALERLLLQERRYGVEAAILRPTAVFGPGGKNLVKLAENLLRQSRIVNYAKSCLQGKRRMNLVHVDNVAAALAFLIDTPAAIDGEIYIVSDDESPFNNYQDVERRLARGLGVPGYPVPPFATPSAVLSLALKMAGRTNTNPHRIYDGSKLVQAGLKKPMPFEEGLSSFASWYRSSRAAGSTA